MADSNTPAALGYRWPAEWEPHAATWLAWPHNRETWPGRLEGARRAFVAMVRALQPRESVCILVREEAMEENARRHLAAGGVDADRNLRFLEIPTNDAWLRDCGPVFVVRNAATQAGRRPARSEPKANEGRPLQGGPPQSLPRVAIVNFDFDSWGRKYPPWDRDDAVPRRAAELLDLPRFDAGLVLEGGSIDGNGRGAILTTESVLLNPNRGAGRSREALERVLAEFLGATHGLWLAGGIEGDDTDGHVDDVARFVDPGTVVAAVETDAADPNSGALSENLRRLRAMRDQDGKPLTLVPLPMPPRLPPGGARRPASYANFYLANGAVLVPTFGGPSDARALAVLAELLPAREVVGIPSADLLVGLGALHCVTQQQPA